MKTFEELVKIEVEKARSKHKPINSVHEGYSVLLEEVDEFWEEVRKKTKERDPEHMLEELTQIGAMAQRCAEDVVIPLLKKNEESKVP
jgi:NTP pyrophosphatase (non-canonical NTP hydrolase)